MPVHRELTSVRKVCLSVHLSTPLPFVPAPVHICKHFCELAWWGHHTHHGLSTCKWVSRAAKCIMHGFTLSSNNISRHYYTPRRWFLQWLSKQTIQCAGKAVVQPLIYFRWALVSLKGRGAGVFEPSNSLPPFPSYPSPAYANVLKQLDVNFYAFRLKLMGHPNCW